MAFEINIDHSGPFEVVNLVDTESGTKATIFSEGVLLNHFSIQKNGATFNVVDGVGTMDEYLKEGNPWFKSAKLSPYVCRLNKGRYKWQNKDYQVKGFFIGDHAIHGLLYNKKFDIISQHADEHQAYVVFSAVYDAEDAGFPFQYECRVIYALQPENRLSLQTVVANTGDAAFPVSDGWHPYFTFGKTINEIELQFTSSNMVEFDEGLIPTGKKIPYTTFNQPALIGETEYDNCFELDQSAAHRFCTLRDTAQGVALQIIPEDSYPYLQIYIPPHRNNIAIENLSSPPDAFNNKIGLKVLEPGESVNFTTSYRLSSF